MNRSRFSRFVLPLLALVLLLTPALPATAWPDSQPRRQEPPVDPQILADMAASPDGTAGFFVLFREQADLAPAHSIQDWDLRGQYVYDVLTATAERSQREVRGWLDARGLAYHPLIAGNEIYLVAGREELQALASFPGVAGFRANYTHPLDPVVVGAPRSLPTGVSWNIAHVGADRVWSELGIKGRNILVADMTTGAEYTHTALFPNYKCGAGPHEDCWYDPANICGGLPCDNNGHGTRVLSIMVGDEDPALPYNVGMAPDAQWIACKGCEISSCSEASLNACFDWFLAPNGNPANRPHVVVMSWSSTGCNSTYQSRVQALWAAGIFPVGSAGISGSGCGGIGSPGDYPEAFATGSTDASDTIATFSLRGPSCFAGEIKPEVTAPGVSVCAAAPGNSWSCTINGSSFAAAHTAGLAALLWSASPDLIGDLVATEYAITSTALCRTDLTCGGENCHNNVYGWGRIDAYQSIAALGPNLSSAKLAPTLIAAGSAFTYTIQLRNDRLPTTHTTIDDPLPTLTTYVSGTVAASSGVVTVTGGLLEWSGPLPNGLAVTVTLQVTISAAATDTAPILNQAVISDSGISDPLVVSVTTIVDAAPPTGSLAIAGGAVYAPSPAVTLTTAASDRASFVEAMQFHDEGQPWGPWENYAPTRTWTLPGADGLKTVYAHYRDAVGHLSADYSDTIVLDTTAPTGSLEINGGAIYTVLPMVTLTAVAGDATSGVAAMQFRNEGEAWGDWEPYTVTRSWMLPTGDGSKIVYARYQDAAGNLSAIYSDTIALDTTAPTVLVDTLFPWYNTVSFTLSWLGSDNLSGIAAYDVQVQEREAGWSGWLTGTTAVSTVYTGRDGQAYTFRIRAADQAGNVGGWFESALAQVDTQRVLQYLHVNGIALESMDTPVTLVVRGNGAVQMRFSNDGSLYTPWEAFAPAKAWTLPIGNGEKVVFAQLTNFLGETQTYTDMITLDTTIPGYPGVSIADGDPSTTQATVTLTLKAPLHAADMLVSNDSRFVEAAWEPYRSQREWVLLYNPYDPTCVVYVMYRLADGTLSQVYIDTIALLVDPVPPPLDNIPPSGSMAINLNDPETTVPEVQLDVLAADDPGGVGLCWMAFREWKFDPVLMQWVIITDSGWLDYSASFPWTLAPGNGVKYVGAWFADCANNVSNPVVLDSINLVEGGGPVGQGEIEHLRQSFTAGHVVTVTLTTSAGDADLYIWRPGSTGTPDYWSNRPGLEVDTVVFTALEGEYLVEVHGYLNSQYDLEVTAGGARGVGQARGREVGPGAWDAGTAAAKPLPQHPLVTTVPGGSGLPMTFSVYLPVVLRDD